MPSAAQTVPYRPGPHPAPFAFGHGAGNVAEAATRHCAELTKRGPSGRFVNRHREAGWCSHLRRRSSAQDELLPLQLSRVSRDVKFGMPS